MESKNLVKILLAIALIIGVCSGYSFDQGNNTLLFSFIFIGFIVLLITYVVMEKGQDAEHGNKIGKF